MSTRLSGTDSMLWHMERPDTPMHTLKIVVLDTSRRGRPVSLDDLATAVTAGLGLVPKARQRVRAARGFGGRPYWVDDPAFAVRDHLDEVTLFGAGDRSQLDAVCAELAERHLPRDRPLWAMTLVHGLAGGRQAVVVRIHHAIADGLGALNTLVAATTDVPGELPELPPLGAARSLTDDELTTRARRELKGYVTTLPRLARDGLAARRRSNEFRRQHPELPPFFGVPRNALNTPASAARRCASGSLPLADVRAVGKAHGATVNGVLHALIAAAIRRELLDRGHTAEQPAVAAFGIAADKSARTSGNFITPTNVPLASHLADPLERLEVTARWCREGVELKRTTGVEMAGRWAVYGPRVLGHLRALLADRKRNVVNHITTANVPGPATSRWIGDIEVVDWISYALAVSPANVNLTVHSYDGRLNIGLVSTPEALPDPHRFIERMREELDVLAQHDSEESALPGVRTLAAR
jgi:WS/DGAT/MGAT family acyltransferase